MVLLLLLILFHNSAFGRLPHIFGSGSSLLATMHGHVPQETNAMGTKWQSVTGRLAMVSVGWSGVWGVTPTQEVPPSQADINRASV